MSEYKSDLTKDVIVRRPGKAESDIVCRLTMMPEANESSSAQGQLQPPKAGLSMRLGFGTAALMSRVNRAGSLRLLETALDAGIMHFDTARSYGFGEAEWVLGDLLAGRRDRVTVTTKVGIMPPARTPALAAAKAMARGVLGIFPGMRTQIRRRAGRLAQPGRFDADTLRGSLETSLRALRTEYVDFLLLHEPSFEVLEMEGPLAFLERVRQEGKVRAFGIAAAPEIAAKALEYAPQYVNTLQVPHSVFRPGLPRATAGQAQGTVFLHSVLSGPLSSLRQDLERDARLQRRWSEELGTDMTEPGWFVGLALAWALTDVPKGVVLFASLNAAHVRENAAALRAAAPVERVQQFEVLAREWMLRGPGNAASVRD